MFTMEHSPLTEFKTYASLPLALAVQPDIKLYSLLAELSPDTSWGQRQIAAEKLGQMGDPQAIPGLLAALPRDSFWMVRCAIIQALEKIGDPVAIPTLREVATQDGFQVAGYPLAIDMKNVVGHRLYFPL